MAGKQEEERIAQQQAFEKKRLGERGRTDPDRGRTDLSRGRTDPDRGRTDLSRGRTDPDRGRTDLSRGFGVGGVPPNAVAADILRAATGLGGHLVVAFVAPVPASCGSSLSNPADSSSGAEALAAAAQGEWADILERVRERRRVKANAPPQSETPGADAAPVAGGFDTSSKAWFGATRD